MTKLFSLAAICVAVMLVVAPFAAAQDKAGPPAGGPPAGGQEKGIPPAGGQEKGGPPAGGAQAAKTFEGQLAKVDTAAKTITVKGAGNMEMEFAYTEQTQVSGPEKDVQGLASKTGSTLRVTYREAGANKVATRIEVAERGGEKGGDKK